MRTVLLCGVEGYIGHTLALRLLEKGYKVYGIDDFQRDDNVTEMGSFSATDIQSPEERRKLFRTICDYEFCELSLDRDYDSLVHFMLGVTPDVIVNLAQQPSAPYSLISREHAEFSTVNNLLGTLNVLYYMREFAPDAHLIQIGSMGEYDHGSGIDIAEGVFDFEFKGRVSKNAIYPRRPGSFYHASKVASTYYIDCACRWWGFKATDIMQGVVYGNWTPEIEKYESHTRLDSDECFGTVVNRFIVQSILNENLTVYGEGEQKRGYLALNDSIQCLMLAIENPPAKGEYRTWNQLDTVHTINDIAKRVIKVAKEFDLNIKKCHIPSPRAEKTTKFDHYITYTDKLQALGFKPSRTMEDEIRNSLEILLPDTEMLKELKHVVLPQITWR